MLIKSTKKSKWVMVRLYNIWQRILARSVYIELIPIYFFFHMYICIYISTRVARIAQCARGSNLLCDAVFTLKIVMIAHSRAPFVKIARLCGVSEWQRFSPSPLPPAAHCTYFVSRPNAFSPPPPQQCSRIYILSRKGRRDSF